MIGFSTTCSHLSVASSSEDVLRVAIKKKLENPGINTWMQLASFLYKVGLSCGIYSFISGERFKYIYLHQEFV